jgi:hypothetical protein
VRLKNARRHRWVTLRTLARLPLHKANHKFLDALEAALTGETATGRSGPLT